MNNYEEAAAFVQEHLGEAFKAVEAKYKEEQAREDALWKAADAACEAFFTDIRERRQRVREQIKSLEQRKAAIGTEKEQLNKELMKAITDGSAGAVEEKRKQLTTLEAELMAIPGQIDGLRNMNIPGDETLYQAAQDAYARWGEHRDKEILDGFKGKASEIFDQIGALFHLGEYKPPVSEWGWSPATQLQRSIEKMEGMFSELQATSIADDDRRSGVLL